MPRQKMIPPLPDALGETEQDRFKRFATAILFVPKSEIETPEQAAARLQAEKRKIEAKTAAVKREKARRKPGVA
jgi:hypothetical protein